MKYLWIIWFLAFGGIFVLYKHQPKYIPETPPSGVDERLWRRGKAMYKGRCTSCHNPNPDLPGSVGPALRGVSEELLIDRLTNGKGAMPIQKNMVRFTKAFREYLK